MNPTNSELALAYPWAMRVERFEDDGSYPGMPASVHPPWFPPRSAWGEGPWATEPDLLEWRIDAAAYPLMIIRGGFGVLCGYVGVPPTHPCHGHTPANFTVSGPSWGLLVPTGDAPDIWWLGFDCGGSHEMGPAMAAGFEFLSKLIEAAGLKPAPPPGHSDPGRYIELGECRERTEELARALVVAASEDVNDG